jgi:hypothetical protein
MSVSSSPYESNTGLPGGSVAEGTNRPSKGCRARCCAARRAEGEDGGG